MKPQNMPTWCKPLFKGFLLFTFLLTIAARADVAPGTLMWFQSSLSSGSGTAEARAVAVDRDDNTIVVGRFVGTVNFFGSYLTSSSATIPSGFVAKFNPNGAPLWVKKIGTTQNTELVSVDTDPAGNIYVGGTASGDYTDSPVAFSIPTANHQDAILLKLDTNSNVLWGKFFGGGGTESILSLKYSKDGMVVFCGNFLSGITIGTDTYISRGNYDIFIGKIKTDGTVLQSFRIGSTNADQVSGINVDSDLNIYLVGTFTTSTDLGSGSVAGPGASNSFLVKYAPGSSIPTWYKFYAGSGVFTLNAVSCGRNNDVSLIGSFSGTCDFGGSAPLTALNGRSAWAAKLAADGNFILNKKFGDGSGANDTPRGGTVGNSGRVSFTGQFKSNPSDWGSYGTTAGNGQLDTTFATMDTNGTVLWARQVPTTNAAGTAAIASTGYGVALTANEDLLVCGFTGAGDYGAGTSIDVGTAGKEAFVARYRGFGPDAASSPTNYAAWAERHFPVQMIDDPAFGGVNGNPFGDGIVNFWKYASSQDPWITGTNPVTTSYATNRFSFSLPRSKAALDARAWLVSSTNLPGSVWTSNATLTTVAPLDANFDQVTLTDAIGVTNTVPAKFLRMRGDTNGP